MFPQRRVSFAENTNVYGFTVALEAGRLGIRPI
jgi:hypothetical protein